MSFPVTVGLNNGDEKVTSSNDRGRALGTKGITPDGRIFRWAENSSVALEASVLVQGAAPNSSNDANLDVANATATGVTTITVVTSATHPANFFKDGTLVVDTSPGQGSYKIASHDANSTGAHQFVLDESDPIRSALTSGTSKVGLLPSRYKDTIVAPTTVTGPLAGVTPVAVAADQFYWVQTAGEAAVNTDVAPAVNTEMIFGGTSAGHINPRTSALNDVPEITIGNAHTAAAGADKVNQITLTLE